MTAANGTVNASLQTGRRDDGIRLTILDVAVDVTLGGTTATARLVEDRPRRTPDSDGYGVIATFRTPSRRLLKIR